MRIFLTGMMGSGKTFWAKKIAAAHDMLFIDLDAYIEEKCLMQIHEIFQQKGEDYFREKESECLKEIITLYDSFVMATGGGTPCFHDNMHLMKKNGRVYYLQTDLSVLAQRVFEAKEIRPLVNNSSIEKIKDDLKEIFSHRKKCYEHSDVIVDMNQIVEANFAKNFITNDK